MIEKYGDMVRRVLDKMIDQDPEQSDSSGYFWGEESPFITTKLAKRMKSRLDQCGWQDEVRLECNRVIKQIGVENLNDDDLVREVLPAARAAVPMEVKRELVAMLKEALMKELEGVHY